MNILGSKSNQFVETPLGLFTVSGNWFYTTSEQINRFAPGLLRKVEMEDLVSKAEVWVKSTDSISILVLTILIQLLPGHLAALSSVVFLILWHLTKSAFITPSSTTIVKWVSFDGFILLLAVASISYLGMQEFYSDMVYGLLFFIVFRFGWIKKGFDVFYDRFNDGITLNDRALKMVIIREALRNDVAIQELRNMEAQILELMQKRKAKPKRKR
ncbi:MAG: hypothetical protein LAT57_07070 [Balneolales bacterium]|nr:hypothetical protein [Balneolales bacterium]